MFIVAVGWTDLPPPPALSLAAQLAKPSKPAKKTLPTAAPNLTTPNRLCYNPSARRRHNERSSHTARYRRAR